MGYAYQWLHRLERCNGTSDLACFCFVSVFSFGIMAKGCHHWQAFSGESVVLIPFSIGIHQGDMAVATTQDCILGSWERRVRGRFACVLWPS